MMLTAKETKQAADFFLKEIDRLIEKPVRFMEVCGTHTVAIFRAGIRQLLPEKVELVSGPGCPVCVTPNDYLDTAIAYARQKDVIIATFGDMLKVPGTSSSLNSVKAEGCDVRIVYSPLDSLQIAKDNPTKKVIFLAVGFETTSPTAAATILTAKAQNIKNFYVLTAHKLTYPAVNALLGGHDIKVDGFLLPGHVCVITGRKPFEFIADRYHLPSVIAGFEPLDILSSIYMLAKQQHEERAQIENQYRRVVKDEGNIQAQKIMQTVYKLADADWRGLGTIKKSGFDINDDFAEFDARKMLPVEKEISKEPAGCRCGEVLKGLVKPTQCPLFGKVCTPNHAVGSCMVSVEGTCAAWYKYGARTFHFE